MSGKGDKPRPKSVPEDIYSANWGAIDWQTRERAEPVEDEEE